MNTIQYFGSKYSSKEQLKLNSNSKKKRQSILNNDFYKDEISGSRKNGSEIISLAYGSRFSTENLPKVFKFDF